MQIMEDKYLKHRPFILNIARKYVRFTKDKSSDKLQELIEELSVKLIEVVKRYRDNPELDKIITKSIKNYIYDFVRSEIKTVPHESLDSLYDPYNRKKIRVYDNLSDSEAGMENLKLNLYLSRIKNKLSYLDYQILLALLGIHTEFNSYKLKINRKKEYWLRRYRKEITIKNIISYFKLTYKEYAIRIKIIQKIVMEEINES